MNAQRLGHSRATFHRVKSGHEKVVQLHAMSHSKQNKREYPARLDQPPTTSTCRIISTSLSFSEMPRCASESSLAQSLPLYSRRQLRARSSGRSP